MPMCRPKRQDIRDLTFEILKRIKNEKRREKKNQMKRIEKE